ncbi:hypothetical protein [Lactobacillus brevis] [Lactiplantibacillus mudanjiangensis]|uniref:hypothetical protein n=1 Tax=Lactiplantibacillus mudanjiangensis TaxID=1296538 RepID=UPI0010159957|nr:hypothetical protein [Lactobacillus brevis] [Lactiplantibacillus mudanjiangensis]
MDLETLQVIFEMNTEKIKPKLDELQEKFSDVIGAIKGDTKSGMSDAEDSMDVGKGQQKVQEQMSEMNDRVEEFSKKIQSAMENGTGAASKAASSNFSRMKTNTTKEVGAMVADINTKMDQARAAEERMMNLKGLRQDALSVGDGKSASRINEQAESAQARMTRYQNQAKALAQQLKGELTAIPNELTKIAHSMDAGEGQIESLRRKIKGLEVAEKAAMKFDPAKGFNAEASIPTDQSRAIGEQIQKQKAKMQGLIDTNDALNRNYAKLEDRSGELKKALRSVNTELGGTTKRARSAKESFSDLSSKLSSVRNRLSSIMGTLGKVTGLSRLANGFKNLNSDARSLTSRLATMGSRGSSSFNKLSRGANKSRGSLEELKQGLKSLPAQFLVWGVGFEAIQKFSQGLLNAAKTDRQFSNSLTQIKANLMTAFYPLYTAIIPWLDSFMSALAKATNWIANFSAALFGMSNSAARSGAANLYKQSKAMSDSSSSTKAATKALQQQNAAITKHNKAMQAAVQAENKAIQSRNAARRKAIQEQNAQIKASNEKRKAAVEAANEKIKASNAAVSAATKKQNEAQKKRIAELKKKYQDYKNSLMGFDEINTLDMSKDIPDYTPKTAKLKALEKFTATPTKSTSFTPEATKSYTPEATKSASDMGYVPDDVDNALAKPMAAMGGAIAAANKFRKVLGELFAPLKAAWAAEGKDVIDAFKYALREIERLLGDIGRSFIKVWDSKTGVRVITDILKLLATVLRIIGDIAKAFAEAWEDHGRGTKLIKSIFDALDAVLKVLIDIGKSFRTAWNDGTGEKIAAHLLDLFTDVNKTITELANSFRKAWNAGDTGTKLFSVWLHDLDKIIQIADEMVNSFRKAWSEGDIGTKIFKDILSIITNIGKLIGSFEDSFRKAWNAGDTGTKMFHAWMVALDKVLKFIDEMIVSFKKAWDQAGLGTKIFSNIFKIIGDIGKTVGNLAGGFTAAWKAGNTGQTIFHTILGIINDILDHIKDMAGYTAEWAKKLDFRPLLTSIKGLFTSIGGLNKTVWDALDWGYKNVLLPLAKFTITKSLPTFFDLLSAAIKVANSVLKALAPLGKALFDTFLKPIASFTGGSGIGAIENIAKALDGLAKWIDKHQKAVQTFAKILAGLFVFKVSTSAFSKGTGLVVDLLSKVKSLNEYKTLLKDFFKGITGIKNLEEGVQNVKTLWSLAKHKWGDYADALVSGWKALKNWSVWSKLAAAGQAILNAAMEVNPYVLLASAIAAVIVVFVELYKHNKKFKKFVSNIYKAITKWLGDALKWIQKNWAKIAEFILNPVGSIATWFLKDTKTGKNIVKWSKARLKDVTEWAQNIGQTISDYVTDGKKLITKAGSNIGKWVSNFRTGTAKNISKWASNLGTTISDSVAGAKKLATSAGTKLGSWVNGFRTKASKTLKSWSTGLGSTVNNGITGAKKLATKAGTTLGGWVNAFRTKASKTAKDWAKGLGSKVHTGIAGAKSLATKAGTKLGGWVNDFRTKASAKVKAWSKGLGKVAHTGVDGAKSLATKAGEKLGKWIQAFQSPTAKKIGKWASGLGGKIATGLKNGVSAISRAAASIANAIVGTIGKAVNGVITGLKWILNHVGAGGAAGGLGYWDVPHFATGGHHKGGPAIVNDELGGTYRESYELPNGRQGLFPDVRNFMVNLPAGTKIKSAASTLHDIPHYKSGIGNFNFSMPKIEIPKFDFDFSGLSSIGDGISNAISTVAGIIGSVWDDVKNPLGVIKSVAERYVGFGDLGGAGLDIAQGGVDMTEKGAVSMIKAQLEKFANKVTAEQKRKEAAAKKAAKSPKSSSGGFNFDFDFSALDGLKNLFKGFATGGFVEKDGLYNLAEDGTEVVLPLTKPERSMQLMREATKYMQANGGVTMPRLATDSTLPASVTSGQDNSATSVRGDGVSGMQEAVVNALMMAMAGQQSKSTSTDDRPIEVTVKVGDETLAKHTIKGINAVNRKNGKNMIDL